MNPLRIEYTLGAVADIADALIFMENAAGQDAADNWEGDCERAISLEAVRHATPPRVRTKPHTINGKACQVARFKTAGGSPWMVYYTLKEDAAKNAVVLRVVRIRHGRANQ